MTASRALGTGQAILADGIRQACEQAEEGSVVVAVLGMAHVDGVARILEAERALALAGVRDGSGTSGDASEE